MAIVAARRLGVKRPVVRRWSVRALLKAGWAPEVVLLIALRRDLEAERRRRQGVA